MTFERIREFASPGVYAAGISPPNHHDGDLPKFIPALLQYQSGEGGTGAVALLHVDDVVFTTDAEAKSFADGVKWFAQQLLQ